MLFTGLLKIVRKTTKKKSSRILTTAKTTNRDNPLNFYFFVERKKNIAASKMSVHTPPQPLLKHVEQSNLCCRIVTDDRALYQLDSLLETFNIVEDIRSNRLLIQSLRAKNVLANVFGEKDLIQFHDFIIHILQPFRWLKQLSSFDDSIQFLHNWHTTRKSNEQSANIPLAEHAIIHTRPFKWRPGDHPNALRYELLERGQLPRRFVGPLKEVGSYLFDACALLMVYRILGDGSLSNFDCKEETKRFLKAYHLRYVEINEEEVLTDLGMTTFFFFNEIS